MTELNMPLAVKLHACTLVCVKGAIPGYAVHVANV